jgi:sporulation protein YtfJ
MEERSIEGLMLTAMDSIRDMIDVNTIIGEPMKIQDNITVIPISKVGFGFAAGGSEFNGQAIKEYNKNREGEEIAYRTPFGGGSGAGVSIKPVAFLVIQDNIVKILPVEHSCTIDKILDYVPDLMEKANKMLDKVLAKENKREIKVVKPKTTKADIVYKFDYNSKDKDEKADDDE